MTPQDIRNYIVSGDQWWHQAAYDAMRRGWCKFIPPRGDSQDGVYLARFWLTRPRERPQYGLDFSNSHLLHFILTEDKDEHMHTHPCSFNGFILSGGYIEERSIMGCFPRERTFTSDDPISIDTVTPHRITSVFPDTWSFVVTGRRQKQWGFMVDGEEVEAYRYLNERYGQ